MGIRSNSSNFTKWPVNHLKSIIMTIVKTNVLVAGANGITGKSIIQLLKSSDNYEPFAMVRKEAQKESFEKKQVKTVLADLEKDVSHALEGIDKVIFAAGSKGKNVIGVDQEGAKKLMIAGKEAGISKYVMLSSMGADDPSKAEDLQDYLKAKQHADNYLKEIGLDYAIIRPGSLTDNEGTGKIKLSKQLNERGEISREDVAKTLVVALEDTILKNKTVEILSGED
jgi:uncharacterized protein YbjT (DUF2867 family)